MLRFACVSVCVFEVTALLLSVRRRRRCMSRLFLVMPEQTVQHWTFCNLTCCEALCATDDQCHSFSFRQRNVQEICVLKDKCYDPQAPSLLLPSLYTSYYTPCTADAAIAGARELSRSLKAEARNADDEQTRILRSSSLQERLTKSDRSLQDVTDTLCSELPETHHQRYFCAGSSQDVCLVHNPATQVSCASACAPFKALGNRTIATCDSSAPCVPSQAAAAAEPLCACLRFEGALFGV